MNERSIEGCASFRERRTCSALDISKRKEVVCNILEKYPIPHLIKGGKWVLFYKNVGVWQSMRVGRFCQGDMQVPARHVNAHGCTRFAPLCLWVRPRCETLTTWLIQVSTSAGVCERQFFSCRQTVVGL